jgi:membrane protein
VLARYNKIYGAFGVVFFVLGWVYFSWCLILWGVELCSAHQNLGDWRRRRRAWGGTPAERETLALRLAALLARPMLESGQPSRLLDNTGLADTLNLPPGPVAELLGLFMDNGLAVRTEEGAYAFARSPEQVSALDILRMARHGRLDAWIEDRGMLEKAAAGLAQDLGARTVRDLAMQPVEQVHTFALKGAPPAPESSA